VYAALGSTVSRMEDANSIVALPMILVIGGFLASMLGLLNPGAAWITVLSYVPFLTPMVMFMRICLGTAAVWETWLAAFLQLIEIAAIAWLGARIYRMGTLMYGKKFNLKDVAKAFKG
jgi:ABC-2 type transport system permease protein